MPSIVEVNFPKRNGAGGLSLGISSFRAVSRRLGITRETVVARVFFTAPFPDTVGPYIEWAREAGRRLGGIMAEPWCSITFNGENSFFVLPVDLSMKDGALPEKVASAGKRIASTRAGMRSVEAVFSSRFSLDNPPTQSLEKEPGLDGVEFTLEGRLDLDGEYIGKITWFPDMEPESQMFLPVAGSVSGLSILLFMEKHPGVASCISRDLRMLQDESTGPGQGSGEMQDNGGGRSGGPGTGAGATDGGPGPSDGMDEIDVECDFLSEIFGTLMPLEPLRMVAFQEGEESEEWCYPAYYSSTGLFMDAVLSIKGRALANAESDRARALAVVEDVVADLSTTFDIRRNGDGGGERGLMLPLMGFITELDQFASMQTRNLKLKTLEGTRRTLFDVIVKCLATEGLLAGDAPRNERVSMAGFSLAGLLKGMGSGAGARTRAASGGARAADTVPPCLDCPGPGASVSRGLVTVEPRPDGSAGGRKSPIDLAREKNGEKDQANEKEHREPQPQSKGDSGVSREQPAGNRKGRKR